MEGKYDIRNILIIILYLAVLFFGGYFMYKVLDPVDKEIDERSRYYLRLYIQSNGEITDIESDNEILKIEMASDGAKLVSYVKDDLTDEIKYVLFELKGLHLYDVETKKIEPLIKEEDYISGDYYLHLGKNIKDILGYFYVSSDETEEYYKDFSKEEKEFNKLKVSEKQFVANSYGDYFIVSKGNECGKGMYIRKYTDDKPLKEGMTIKNLILKGKSYYLVIKECDGTVFDMYDSDLNLIKENLNSLFTSFDDNYYYVIEDKKIVKYDFSSKELSSNEYSEVLELHDGYALLRDNKALYILDIKTNKKTTLADLSDESNDVNEAIKGDFNGRFFSIDHQGNIAIALRIRNINYDIKKDKVS